MWNSVTVRIVTALELVVGANDVSAAFYADQATLFPIRNVSQQTTTPGLAYLELQPPEKALGGRSAYTLAYAPLNEHQHVWTTGDVWDIVEGVISRAGGASSPFEFEYFESSAGRHLIGAPVWDDSGTVIGIGSGSIANHHSYATPVSAFFLPLSQ